MGSNCEKKETNLDNDRDIDDTGNGVPNSEEEKDWGDRGSLKVVSNGGKILTIRPEEHHPHVAKWLHQAKLFQLDARSTAPMSPYSNPTAIRDSRILYKHSLRQLSGTHYSLVLLLCSFAPDLGVEVYLQVHPPSFSRRGARSERQADKIWYLADCLSD